MHADSLENVFIKRKTKKVGLKREEWNIVSSKGGNDGICLVLKFNDISLETFEISVGNGYLALK